MADFKPTKSEHALIMKMVRTLPPMHNRNQIVRRAISGNEALQLGVPPPKGEDFFDLDKEYTVPMLQKVNHKRYALNAFKKGKINAVIDYCKTVVDIHNKQITEALQGKTKK